MFSMKLRRFLLVSAVVFLDVSCAWAQLPTYNYYSNRQGFHMRFWLSAYGTHGRTPIFFETNNPLLLGCEYPLGSPMEHILQSSIWIGALIDTGMPAQPILGKRVTTSEFYFADDSAEGSVPSEFFPLNIPRPWFRTSINNVSEPNRRDFDDDGDGPLDEDELDGEDNDGDGKIDEDYAAFSESDLYSGFTDTVRLPGFYHVPLGIKVWQRSYAWGKAFREPILPIEYIFVNVGNKVLQNAYIGMNCYPTVAPVYYRAADFRNYAGFWPNLRTAYADAPLEQNATPIGFTVLRAPQGINTDQFSYGSFFFLPFGDFDDSFYDMLSWQAFPGEPRIRPNQPITDLGRSTIIFSFGPMTTWSPGETLRVAIALVSGMALESGSENLKDNARLAQTLHARNYKLPLVLPAPKLSITRGERRATLSWGNPGSADDPRNVWDEENDLVSFYPPDHWRRTNPPAGSTKGGRVFEGFRLYRSEDPAGTAKSFTLLRQWDMIDSVGPPYEFDTGIETTLTDSNLIPGKTYWYSLTSFGIPDLHVIDYVDFDGSVKQETLRTPSLETSVLASRKRVKLTFPVSQTKDQVKVVPNPYRVDEEYTFENGGWEGRGRSWNEEKRLIKFIHLPELCTIRIFSLAGDVITTIQHDDPVRGEADWNLMSESGRAIASGVYVFTVESRFGRQIGKFAVIR